MIFAFPQRQCIDAAGTALEKYPFPGNVRELEHMIDRVAVQAGGRAITIEEIDDQISRNSTSQTEPSMESLLALPFHDAVANLEKQLLQDAVIVAGNNKAEAARRLGMRRRLVYEKLQQYRLS